MMRGMAVPTTVWSSEPRNMAIITPTRVIMTCFRGKVLKLPACICTCDMGVKTIISQLSRKLTH